MTGPRRPDRPPRDPGDLGRPIGPGPIRRPIPWTPFGPGDNATPDVTKIVKRAERTMEQLRRAQLELTRMKSGPGPDGTDPVVEDVSRADGLWPYLLIRHDVGDVGIRPLAAETRVEIDLGRLSSPDILLTEAGPPDEPHVIDRKEFPALIARAVHAVNWGSPYDIWVHVWNLGQAQATGVRVRAFLRESDRFLDGRQLDLGDRLSPTCHRVVKVATYTWGTWGDRPGTQLVVVAECLSDVASGDRSPGMDRHCAHRFVGS